MKIKLLKDHTHGGVAYHEGDQISLSDDSAKRLIAKGVGVAVGFKVGPTAGTPEVSGSFGNTESKQGE